MTNPYKAYAYFPDELPARPVSLKNNNFCELIGVDFHENRIVDSYCRCENCPVDVSIKQAVCCRDVVASETLWSKNWQNYISNCEKCFIYDSKIVDIVTNVFEIDNFIIHDQLRLQDIAKLQREPYINEYNRAEEDEKYRFACYRKITQLVHKTTGFKKRVQLPACVVAFIRKTYPSPSNEYTGFEDFSDEE
jgi:hypothetical protein|uniref:P2X purinoreceptor 7 intracellular domain-containing protein n=1 Tax=Panagrolaimus sp. PS1159 TaxID=55785 RepID=A0AC35G3H9_9BILA